MLKIPILTYHDILSCGFSQKAIKPLLRPYVLGADSFEKHLSIIHSEGFKAVSIERILTEHGKAAPSSEKSVSITFDDGLLNNYLTAFPLLKKFDYSATFFVIASKIGENSMMSWGHLKEMIKNGMTIGSHTLTHRYPSELNEQEIRYELVESKRLIEDKLEAKIEFLSVPTGFHNKKMLEIAKETGYRGVCSGIEGVVTSDSDPYSLPSFCIRNNIKDKEFIKLLHCDTSIISVRRFKQLAYKTAKKILGVKKYEALKLALSEK